MSENSTAPVSGTCDRCGCALGYHASASEDGWYCCGACASSDRCTCGCKPEFTRELPPDSYVPTRRMFASRHPEGLKTRQSDEQRSRAFPFAHRRR